jgi:hypothetical protein
MLHNITKYPVYLKPMRRFTDPIPRIEKEQEFFLKTKKYTK